MECNGVNIYENVPKVLASGGAKEKFFLHNIGYVQGILEDILMHV